MFRNFDALWRESDTRITAHFEVNLNRADLVKTMDF